MTATREQRKLLDILDVCGLLADIQSDLRDVITRIANRAKTADEADDLAILIAASTNLAKAQDSIAKLHPDHRIGAEGR